MGAKVNVPNHQLGEAERALAGFGEFVESRHPSMRYKTVLDFPRLEKERYIDFKEACYRLGLSRHHFYEGETE